MIIPPNLPLTQCGSRLDDRCPAYLIAQYKVLLYNLETCKQQASNPIERYVLTGDGHKRVSA